MNYKITSGMVFGKLTTIARCEPENNAHNHYYWACQCQCGNTHVVRMDYLRNGKSTHCGCLRKPAHKNLQSKAGKNKRKEGVLRTAIERYRSKSSWNTVFDAYNGRELTLTNTGYTKGGDICPLEFS